MAYKPQKPPQTDIAAEYQSAQILIAQAAAIHLQLAGARIGCGDLLKTLKALHLVIGPDNSTIVYPENSGTATISQVLGTLTEKRDCPKCGDAQLKLKNAETEDGWWHEEDGWYYRRCPEN